MSLLSIALAVALLATVYSFICGVSSMATHGEVGHHTGEQWMAMRVGFQALAVVLLLVILVLQ